MKKWVSLVLPWDLLRRTKHARKRAQAHLHDTLTHAPENSAPKSTLIHGVIYSYSTYFPELAHLHSILFGHPIASSFKSDEFLSIIHKRNTTFPFRFHVGICISKIKFVSDHYCRNHDSRTPIRSVCAMH